MTMRTHLCALGTVRRSTLRWLTPWALEPELVRGNWANGKIGLLLKMLNCYPLCPSIPVIGLSTHILNFVTFQCLPPE